MKFEEKTWEWATTPPEQDPYTRYFPIEGGILERDDEWRAKILERLEDVEKWPNVEFIVFVQNIALGERNSGAFNVIIAGPGYTWGAEQIEELKENSCKYWFGDLPSERMYPQWYISRESHLKAKETASGGTDPGEDPNRGQGDPAVAEGTGD